ncbi:hypothetical protein LX36DRAFT_414815 [Colletotrichum falcatum]|nr:hypothetical protein LX36DRAFT_414815 [Colletotrichum falcatum]
MLSYLIFYSLKKTDAISTLASVFLFSSSPSFLSLPNAVDNQLVRAGFAPILEHKDPSIPLPNRYPFEAVTSAFCSRPRAKLLVGTRISCLFLLLLLLRTCPHCDNQKHQPNCWTAGPPTDNHLPTLPALPHLLNLTLRNLFNFSSARLH